MPSFGNAIIAEPPPDIRQIMRLFLPAFSASPEDYMMHSLILEAIEGALMELPEEQREVFILHEFENMSFNEMVELTGENKNTLISRKHYAILYLRECLQDLYNQLNQ